MQPAKLPWKPTIVTEDIAPDLEKRDIKLFYLTSLANCTIWNALSEAEQIAEITATFGTCHSPYVDIATYVTLHAGLILAGSEDVGDLGNTPII